MRKATTAVLAAVAAVPLAFLAAAPASAAPGDIDAVFTTTPNPGGGNTVTGTFTATGDALPFYCEMADAGTYVPEIRQFSFYASARPDRPSPTITVADADVADGTYTVDWVCLLDGETDRDGSDGYLGAGYSQPTTLVVPAVVPEEPEVPPVCTGSACLPTGSFGF